MTPIRAHNLFKNDFEKLKKWRSESLVCVKKC